MAQPIHQDDIKAWGYRSFQNKSTEKYLRKVLGADYKKYEVGRSKIRMKKVEKKIGHFINSKSGGYYYDDLKDRAIRNCADYSAITGVGIWASYYNYDLPAKALGQLKARLENEIDNIDGCDWDHSGFRRSGIKLDLQLIKREMKLVEKEETKRLQKMMKRASRSRSPKKRRSRSKTKKKSSSLTKKRRSRSKSKSKKRSSSRSKKRPSPSEPAKNFKGKRKKGGDGKMWHSKADINGIYRWYRVKK